MIAMQDSTGALDNAYDTYLDSMQAHINKFKAATQELSDEMVNNSLVNVFVSIGTAGVSAFTKLISLTNSLGATFVPLVALAGSFLNVISKTERFKKALTGLSAVVKGLSNPVVATVAGLTAVVGIVSAIKRHMEDMRVESQQAAQEFSKFSDENNKTSEDAIARIAELKAQIASGDLSTSELYNAEKELLSIQGELVDYYGSQAESLNLLSTSANEAAEAIRNLNQAYLEQKANEYLTENASSIRTAKREMEKVVPFIGRGTAKSSLFDSGIYGQVAEIFNRYGVSIDAFDGGSDVSFEFRFDANVRDAEQKVLELSGEIYQLSQDLSRGMDGIDLNEMFFGENAWSFEEMFGAWLSAARKTIGQWGEIYDEAIESEIALDKNYSRVSGMYREAAQAYTEAVTGVFESPDARLAAVNAAKGLMDTARDAFESTDFGVGDERIQSYFQGLFDSFYSSLDETTASIEKSMKPLRSSAEIEADIAAYRDAFIAGYDPYLAEISSYESRVAEATEALGDYYGDIVPSREDIANYKARMGELEDVLSNAMYGAYNGLGKRDLTTRPSRTYADLEFAGWEGLLKYDNADDFIPPAFSFMQAVSGSDYTYLLRVSPVLDDGSVLSPASLQEYIGNVLDFDHDIDGLFASDRMGVVLDVALGEADGGVDTTGLQARYDFVQELTSEYFTLADAVEKYEMAWQLAEDEETLRGLYEARDDLLSQVGDLLLTDENNIALQNELADALEREAAAAELAEQQRLADIRSLTSMSNELAASTAALEAYNKATAGEHGELADSYSSAYKKFLEDWNAGKTGTKAVQAAVELFLPDDVLRSLNYDIQRAGELLSSELYQSIFNGENDPGLNFFNAMQDYADELNGIVDINGDLENGFTFSYSSLSDLAYAFGISEEACAALLDSLDAYGVQVMMSAEDTAELAGKLNLTEGAVVSTREGIQGIANDLAAAGNKSTDISRILQSLESAGYVDLSGLQGDLGDIIKAAREFYVAPPEDPDVTVEVDSTQVDEAQSKVDALNATTLTPKIQRVTVIETHLGGESAMASGGVVKHGGATLVNELGPELISENGRAYIAGGGEPTIVDLSPDAIVLDADDTKRALSGRGKFAGGTLIGSAAGGLWSTATSVASGFNNNIIKPIAALIKANNKTNDDGGGGGGGPSNSKSKNNKNNDDKQKIDWIEVLLDRLTRAIDTFGKRFENTAKTFDSRISEGFVAEAYKIREGYERYQQGYDRYIQEANSVGLDESLAALVRDGTIDIRAYDEETKKLITDYQTWYNKAVECSEALEDLHSKLQEIYQARYDLVQTRYENQLTEIEHRAAMIEKDLDMVESRGYMKNARYYQELRDTETSHLATLREELSMLSKYFNDTMINGEIDEGSEAYYEMKQAIEEVEEAIADANLQLVEYEKTIRQLNWDNFDYAAERFKQMTDEADFFVELLGNKKLFQDNGQFTDAGNVTSAMHVLDYNAYMAQADAYAKELQKIQKELAADPYDTALIERREQLLSLQRESILSAEAEKDAIRDLVSDGIDLELSALKDLIDAYKDSVDSAKDLYEYQKKVSEKTADIATIQKQLAAYAGDTSEENRARIQKLNQDLKKAQEDLSDTEREQSISEQKKLLDDLYDEYEELLTSRLDDVDALMREMIERTNANLDGILTSTQSFGEEVGYTITESFRQVLGDTFTDVNTVSRYLDGIYSTVLAMAEASGSVRAYASGGLADYTGYAMLHGTPGRPELVLNATDTQNFLDAARLMRRIPNLDTARFGGFGGTNIGAIEMNIQIDHVDDYNDLVSQMQADPKFEKLVKAMTLDQITGKSGFRKNQIKF